MLCRRCFQSAACADLSSTIATWTTYTIPRRFFSVSTRSRNAAPVSSPSAAGALPPSSSTSTSTHATKKPATPTLVLSSVPAGTPLKGLNFLKNKSDPVAMEDSEYPAWLWAILEKKDQKTGNEALGDLFSKSKKQRRLAAKRLRKEQAQNPDAFAPKVPIYEQTIDLPAGDGTVEGAVQALGAREELKKAMRVKRRANIKEGNFLKSMS